MALNEHPGPLTPRLVLCLPCTTQELDLVSLNCLTKLLEQRALTSLLGCCKVWSFLNPADFIAVEKNTFPKTHAVLKHATSDGFTFWEAILHLLHNSSLLRNV